MCIPDKLMPIAKTYYKGQLTCCIKLRIITEIDHYFCSCNQEPDVGLVSALATPTTANSQFPELNYFAETSSISLSSAIPTAAITPGRPVNKNPVPDLYNISQGAHSYGHHVAPFHTGTTSLLHLIY